MIEGVRVRTMNQVIEDAAKLPPVIYTNPGIKFTVERKDGAITTWTQTFDNPIEDIIKDNIERKRWQGGKFTKIALHIHAEEGRFEEVSVVVDKYNELLK